ncbi:Vacuolar protein-sorting-associated protein 60 [Savitreella phatthalungensis]
MNRIFGTRKAAPTPSLADAIAATDARADAIQVKIHKLDIELGTHQQRMSRLRGAALEAAKKRALGVLRQKKMYEAQLDQLTQQSFNMEQANLTTENMRNTMTTVTAMQHANKALKKEYGKIDIDKVERLQDEMADLIESANELSAVMGRNVYDLGDDIDEEELEAELDALAEEGFGLQETETGAGLSYLSSAVDGAPPEFLPEDGVTEEPKATAAS